MGAPVNGYVCTIQVEDVVAMMEKVAKLGATVAMPKFAIPGMAWQAYMIDQDGNIFGLHRADANAR